MSSQQESEKRHGFGESIRLFQRFLPYFKPYRAVLFMDLFCAALTSACELVLPLIVRGITETGTNDISQLTLAYIARFAILYLVLRAIDTAASYYQLYQGHVMGARIETDLRRDFFNHLQALSNAYYDNAKVGQLMSRISSDLNDITEFAHHFPEEVFVAALKIAISFAILLTIDGPLTLIIYAAIPVMAYFSLRNNWRMRDAFRRSRFHLGELNAQVEDSLLGIRVVKAFANETIEEKKFQRGNDGFLEIKDVMYKWLGRFHATTRMFDGLMYLLVLVSGALFLRAGHIDSGDFIAFMLYVNMLIAAVHRMVEFTEQFQRGMSGIERFVDVMDEPVEIRDAPDAVPIERVKGDITFDHVSFSYGDDNEYVLTDINLHAKAGQSIALVGPSGGGKTTLLNLIPRFYEATKGRVLLDGVDIRSITLKSLRENIGVVQQDVYLFAGNVADNIEYGHPGARREDIIRAAMMAGAHEFIEQLPDGYETYVGERGVKLSGGQKQRIAIARVFLKDPPVLILDEATSALDNESEQLVQRSLDALMKGRTTFTIAHRLTTIRGASTILVLTEHGIVEQGTREELMAKKGVYFNLESAYGDPSATEH